MRKSLAITSLCLIAAVTSLAQADENDLFSSVRTESVFEPSTGAPTAPAPARRANPLPELEVKISNSGELARKLRLAGLQVEEDSENRMVSTKTKLGQWTFPVLIVISEDGNQLMIALLLSSASSEDQIPKDKLLELLQANRKYAPSSFGYSSKRKRTELYHMLKNQVISGQKLRDEIDRLATIASETASLWSFGTKSQTPASKSQTPGTELATTPTESPKTTPSLAGKWVATRSANEAFAIKLNADGTFLLVYVNKGKQTRSNGKFSRNGQQLTLEGSGGVRLSGTVSGQTEKEFQFLPANSAAGTANLVFKRA